MRLSFEGEEGIKRRKDSCIRFRGLHSGGVKRGAREGFFSSSSSFFFF